MTTKRDPLGDFLAGVLGEVREDARALTSAIEDLPRAAGSMLGRVARDRFAAALDRAAAAARGTPPPKAADAVADGSPNPKGPGLSGFAWRK